MSSLKEIFDSFSNIPAEPIAPVVVVPTEESQAPAQPAAPQVDIEDVDWESFTIGGAPIVDLLRKAINKLVIEYNQLPDRADGLTFTLGEIFEAAGLADVCGVYSELLPEEESLVMLEDDDLMNWRYYVVQKALESFEGDWDVELQEAERPDASVVNMIFDSITTVNSILPFYDKMLEDANDPSLRHNVRVLLNEESLKNDVVVMTAPEEDEFEDDDEDENKEPENVCPNCEPNSCQCGAPADNPVSPAEGLENPEDSVRVIVNGKPIQLNPHSTNFIHNFFTSLFGNRQ